MKRIYPIQPTGGKTVGCALLDQFGKEGVARTWGQCGNDNDDVRRLIEGFVMQASHGICAAPLTPDHPDMSRYIARMQCGICLRLASLRKDGQKPHSRDKLLDPSQCDGFHNSGIVKAVSFQRRDDKAVNDCYQWMLNFLKAFPENDVDVLSNCFYNQMDGFKPSHEGKESKACDISKRRTTQVERYHGRSSFFGFMGAVLRNNLIDVRRHEQNKPDGYVYEDYDAPMNDDASGLEKKETRKAVEELIRKTETIIRHAIAHLLSCENSKNGRKSGSVFLSFFLVEAGRIVPQNITLQQVAERHNGESRGAIAKAFDMERKIFLASLKEQIYDREIRQIAEKAGVEPDSLFHRFEKTFDRKRQNKS